MSTSRFALSMAFRGKLKEAMAADQRAGAVAMTNVFRRKAAGVKRRLRRQIVGAGMGDRFSKTVRDNTFPKRGHSLQPNAMVWSTAWVKGSERRVKGYRRDGVIDLITVFDEGATIGPRRSRYLAIPTPYAQRIYGHRLPGRRQTVQPNDLADGRLLFLPNPPRLVLRNYPETIMFVLVKTVRIRPRIDVDKAAALLNDVAHQVTRDWDRRSQRAFSRLK